MLNTGRNANRSKNILWVLVPILPSRSSMRVAPPSVAANAPSELERGGERISGGSIGCMGQVFPE